MIFLNGFLKKYLDSMMPIVFDEHLFQHYNVLQNGDN